ncbi:hypothetical protein DAPPUDRAFT_107740 [Daphnia pulex]|uniref:Uncharacterized protein n=1 Tax=Daphnia pulex TaxID=6669 RepID=E9GY29_DAPPU|nr:hypothetical protein DAPPUDRAFT_107740 [Daphnia pulex]|eukprot:EFX75527.1 hypothetical protein DAPPUDRAFT_107740 [Daphnia pulex]
MYALDHVCTHSSLAFFSNLSSVEETLTNAKLTLKMKVNPRPAHEIATIETPFLTTTKQAAACSMELDHYKYKAVELPVSNEEDEGTSVLLRPSSSLSIDKWNNFKKKLPPVFLRALVLISELTEETPKDLYQIFLTYKDNLLKKDGKLLHTLTDPNDLLN